MQKSDPLERHIPIYQIYVSIHSIIFYYPFGFFLYHPGSMHGAGALRSGQIKKPHQVQDVYVPLQKAYKNAKLWHGANTKGTVSLKPTTKAKKSTLKEHFKEQVKQIWQVKFEADVYSDLPYLISVLSRLQGIFCGKTHRHCLSVH